MGEKMLRWKSHHQSVHANLYCYYINQEMVDTTLVFKDGEIKAHAIILCAGSRYFRNILNTNELEHRKCIILESIPKKIMEYLIEFLYKGQVSVPVSELKKVLDASQLYEVRGIRTSNNDSNSSLQILENSSDKMSPLRGEKDASSENIEKNSSSTSLVIRHKPNLKRNPIASVRNGNDELSPIHLKSPKYSRIVNNSRESVVSTSKNSPNGQDSLSLELSPRKRLPKYSRIASTSRESNISTSPESPNRQVRLSVEVSPRKTRSGSSKHSRIASTSRCDKNLPRHVTDWDDSGDSDFTFVTKSQIPCAPSVAENPDRRQQDTEDDVEFVNQSSNRIVISSTINSTMLSPDLCQEVVSTGITKKTSNQRRCENFLSTDDEEELAIKKSKKICELFKKDKSHNKFSTEAQNRSSERSEDAGKGLSGKRKTEKNGKLISKPFKKYISHNKISTEAQNRSSERAEGAGKGLSGKRKTEKYKKLISERPNYEVDQFCILCFNFFDNIAEHIRKKHKVMLRNKNCQCPDCGKKFYRAAFVDKQNHKCIPKQIDS